MYTRVVQRYPRIFSQRHNEYVLNDLSLQHNGDETDLQLDHKVEDLGKEGGYWEEGGCYGKTLTETWGHHKGGGFGWGCE